MSFTTVKEKATTYINTWKWFSIALIIIAAILLYKTCNPPQLPLIPAVIPVAEQKEKVRVDSVASQKYKDSVNEVLKHNEKAAEQWYSEWKASEMRYADLEKGMDELIDQPVPDTCQEMKNAYVKKMKELSLSAQNTKVAHKGAMDAKNAIILNKDALIAKGKEDYKKLKINFDTCISQQQKLSKAIKQVKSKTEIYAGIMAMGSEIKPFEGTGVNIGLRTRKGNQYEVFALQFNSGIHYGISIKKTLFKF